MKEQYRALLIIILLGGSLFSLNAVYQDFVRFYNYTEIYLGFMIVKFQIQSQPLAFMA